MTTMTDTARTAVMDAFRVVVSYHGVKRQFEYASGHTLMARKHNAAYLWMKRALRAEDLDPPPKPPCGCLECSALYAAGRR